MTKRVAFFWKGRDARAAVFVLIFGSLLITLTLVASRHVPKPALKLAVAATLFFKLVFFDVAGVVEVAIPHHARIRTVLRIHLPWAPVGGSGEGWLYRGVVRVLINSIVGAHLFEKLIFSILCYVLERLNFMNLILTLGYFFWWYFGQTIMVLVDKLCILAYQLNIVMRYTLARWFLSQGHGLSAFVFFVLIETGRIICLRVYGISTCFLVGKWIF